MHSLVVEKYITFCHICSYIQTPCLYRIQAKMALVEVTDQTYDLYDFWMRSMSHFLNTSFFTYLYTYSSCSKPPKQTPEEVQNDQRGNKHKGLQKI